MKRNHVKVFGKGEQPLLFGHGFGCEQSMWQYITPAFEEKYKIILFDYVGSGASDMDAYDSEKYSSLKGYTQDLLDVIEALNLKDVYFVGHSISSMIGMLASIEKPECFSKLIMIGPSPCYINTEDGYYGGFEESDVQDMLGMMEMNFVGWANYLAPIAMHERGDSLHTQELQRTFVANNQGIAREFAEVTFFSDCRNQLALANKPTLIMQCSEDSIVPVETGEYLHQHLKNSEIRYLQAKGHYPHISNPEETISIIQEYLNGKSKE